jgi:hypothetical protein
MKNLAAGRCFRTRTKGQGRKSVTPPRLAIDATVEEKSSAAGRLFVGFYEGKKLKFAGRVGTGFSEKLLSTLFSKQYEDRLDDPAERRQRFSDSIRWRGAAQALEHYVGGHHAVTETRRHSH